jgi:hypothetical protein
MMTDLQTKVAESARRLWEAAGRPEGRDVEFWCMAERWVIQEAGCRERLAPRCLAFPKTRIPTHRIGEGDATGTNR